MGFPVLGSVYGEDSIFNAPLIAQEYGGNSLFASRLVFLSTLLSLVILPVVPAVLKGLVP